MSCRSTRMIGALAVTSLAVMPVGAAASPATETDLFEIRKGLVTANVSGSYDTAYVFRGVKQNDETMRLKLNLRTETGVVDLNLGAVGYVPIEDQHSGIDEPKEIDLFALGRFEFLGLITEAGATYYTYPDAEDIGDKTVDTLELHAGIKLPLVMPLIVRASYDVDLQNITLETEARWRIPVWGDRLTFELSGHAGIVQQGDDRANQEAVLAGARTLVEGDVSLPGFDDKDTRAFYGVGAAVSSKITDNIVLGAHVNWAGTTGEYSFDGVTTDNTIWGGITLTAGF